MNASKAGGEGQLSVSGEHRDITAAARLLATLTLLSRIAGLTRDLVIAALFGASGAADAFFVAFRIPNLFRRVVAEGATSTAFVPVFTWYRSRRGDREAARAAVAVGGAALATLSVLVVAGVAGASWVISVFAPGFAAEPSKQGLAVALVRLTFPYLLFVGLAAWAMGVLHAFRRFLAPALGPILLNLAIIASALLLSPRLERPIYALAIGVLIGGALQFAVQAPSLVAVGLRPRAAFQGLHPAVGRVGRLLVPTLFGGAVYQIGILLATVFASLLPERSISYLWYADRVFEFPLGIVAVAVGTAALPSLSAQASERRLGAMADTAAYALRLVWALCIPATIGLWLLAPTIVEVLFERGRFTPLDTSMTAWALRAYAVGMLGVASVRVLVSVFYALEKPRIPVATATMALLLNALCDLALMGPPAQPVSWWGAGLVARLQAAVAVADFDHAGLALGTGIAAIVNAGLLFVLAGKLLGRSVGGALGTSALRHALAAVVMATVVVLWQKAASNLPAPLELAGAILLGCSAYIGAALALGSDEVRALLARWQPAA